MSPIEPVIDFQISKKKFEIRYKFKLPGNNCDKCGENRATGI